MVCDMPMTSLGHELFRVTYNVLACDCRVRNTAKNFVPGLFVATGNFLSWKIVYDFSMTRAARAL